MAKRQSLKRQLREELFRQAKKGFGVSRHETKRQTGTFAQHATISSSRSLSVHISHSKQFADWVKENRPECRNLSDITPEVAKDYLRYRDAHFRPKTVSADVTMLNHIVRGTKNPSFDKSINKKDYGLTFNREVPVSKNRGAVNSSNTRVVYSAHNDIVKVGQAFGLRRSELVPTKEQAGYAITNRSLYEKDGRIHVATFGKGGRYRTVEVLATHEPFIRQNYGNIVQTVERLPSADEFKQVHEQAQPLFHSCSRSIPIHIVCRQFYANEKLVELEQSGRAFPPLLEQNTTKTNHPTYTTNGRTMDREIAQYLSFQLGHNRIYELRSYVNVA